MKVILKLSVFFLAITSLYAQDNICDCVQVGIETIQSIQRGASEETVQKRFEKENKICDELSQNLGEEFQKKMASCENFPKFIQLMAGGDANVKPSDDVCNCLDISIKILKEIQQGISEKKIEEKYQKESEICDKLSNKLGQENFGMQLMNCDGFGTLMELLMNEEE